MQSGAIVTLLLPFGCSVQLFTIQLDNSTNARASFIRFRYIFSLTKNAFIHDCDDFIDKPKRYTLISALVRCTVVFRLNEKWNVTIGCHSRCSAIFRWSNIEFHIRAILFDCTSQLNDWIGRIEKLYTYSLCWQNWFVCNYISAVQFSPQAWACERSFSHAKND